MPARVADLPALKTVREVIALHDEVWNRSPGIHDLLLNSTRCFVVRDNKETVSGYAFVEEDRSRGFVELQDIAVSPRSRGQGYGALLMDAVMTAYPRVKLVVRAQNVQLVAFYEKLGFVAEGVIENYYDVGEDGLRMTWSRDRGGRPG
jgi:ribosomal protein S18 acetylase RimI-like enzyme